MYKKYKLKSQQAFCRKINAINHNQSTKCTIHTRKNKRNFIQKTLISIISSFDCNQDVILLVIVSLKINTMKLSLMKKHQGIIEHKRTNIKSRNITKENGYKQNEYGLFELNTQKKIAGKTAEDIYQKLHLKYLQPVDRKYRH